MSEPIPAEDQLQAVGAEVASGGDLIDDADDVREELAGLVRQNRRHNRRLHLGLDVVQLHEPGGRVASAQGVQTILDEFGFIRLVEQASVSNRSIA
jgi:hypothetical protein